MLLAESRGYLMPYPLLYMPFSKQHTNTLTSLLEIDTKINLEIMKSSMRSKQFRMMS